MKPVIINDQIVADPNICHGKPTFKGTRIMVWQVLEMLASGMTDEEIISDFPDLSQKHIRAALKYASSITRDGYVTLNLKPSMVS